MWEGIAGLAARRGPSLRKVFADTPLKAQGIGRIGAPRPTLSRVTTKRRQVSWLAGCRLGPPSQSLMAPVA